MADAAQDREAARAEFRRLVGQLVASGMKPEQAAPVAMARVRGSLTRAPDARREYVDPAESLGRGALQGATLGYADELGGAAVAHPARDPMDRLAPRGTTPPRMTQEQSADAYRTRRDAIRADDAAAREANPKTFIAGQIAGGVATAPIMPAASTVKGAAALGAAYGGAAGLGESEADLTRGEYGQAALDTGRGAVVGGILGGGAQGVVNKVRARGEAARAAREAPAASAPVRREATKAATEVAGNADLPSMIGKGETIRTATEKAKGIMDEASAMLGERYRLRPSQVAGDPALALKESKAAQFPTTMLKSQAEEARRLEQSAKLLDMYVGGIASDPSRLGRADVGNQLTQVVKHHIDNLRETRSRVAAELFGQVDEIAGGKKIVKMQETAKTIMQLIEEMRSPLATGPSKAATAELMRLGDELTKSAGGGAPVDAMFSSRELQNALADWGKKAASTEDVFKDIDRATGQRMSKQIFKALQRDLDGAAGDVATEKLGAAGQALIGARDVYRDMSKAIDEASTETVERILKIGGTDAADRLSTRLMNASPEEVSGVFRVLNRADPSAAQQLRAQLFEEVLSKGGKPNRAAPLAAESGVAKLSPRSTLSALEKAEPMLQAAFEGDGKAKLALSKAYRLLQRLDFGPNIRGSQTAPLLAQQAVDEAGDAAALAAAGPQGLGLWRGVKAFLTNEKAKAEAFTTPEGIDAFNRILEGALSLKEGKKLSDEAARAMSVALTRYTITETQPERERRHVPSQRGSY